jgi:metal-responsive CopG/Arc/MetJ family transcriptional regulator
MSTTSDRAAMRFVSMRLPLAILLEVDELAALEPEPSTRSAIIRRAIKLGLRELRRLRASAARSAPLATPAGASR